MNRDFIQPEFRDLHDDLSKLVESRFYNERALEALKAARDLIVAADAYQEIGGA